MAKSYTTDVSVVGGNVVIKIGEVSHTVPVADINPSYLAREFARGLKLRIDNASAGVEEDAKKLDARLKMYDKIDFKDPSGGISGGRKKETGEAFMARYQDDDGKSTITNLEEYQAAMADATASVRKDEQAEVMTELSMLLTDILG